MIAPKFSVVIPVYNRPQEIEELLESLANQTTRNFEIIVVEDGSAVSSEDVVRRYQAQTPIRYLYKENSGPGPSRNAGFAVAKGDYLVVFDSDCVLPPTYFEAVERGIQQQSLDAFGGPDRAHEKFTLLQRAMGYTMSSALTTGGIRGGKRRMGWFQPRSFNMGFSRKVYEATGGFHFDRFAEDIELSIRMKDLGFRVGLIDDAFVYHRRRTGFGQFFQQVFNFGKGRALIGKRYSSEVKITHWIPTFFTLATIAMLVLWVVNYQAFVIALSAFSSYLFIIFLHCLMTTGNIFVALLSIPSALLQFFGYGTGFLFERLKPRRG